MDEFAPFELDWWLPQVREIADQFVRASAGDVDLSFWQNIYKQIDAYGYTNANGWLLKLVPYLKHIYTGNFTDRNPLLADANAVVTSDTLPSGLSMAPFVFTSPLKRKTVAMEMLGGFVGITQDPETLALRPKLGWAVRESPANYQVMARVGEVPHADPLGPEDFDRCLALTERIFEFSGDFLLFYKTCNGLTLPAHGTIPSRRFLPLEETQVLKGQSYPTGTEIKFMGLPWLRFCDLGDGTFLAVELKVSSNRRSRVQRSRIDPTQPGINPTVALSFLECLEQALDNDPLFDQPVEDPDEDKLSFVWPPAQPESEDGSPEIG